MNPIIDSQTANDNRQTEKPKFLNKTLNFLDRDWSEKVLHFLKEFPAWTVLLIVGTWLLIFASRIPTPSPDDLNAVEYSRFLQRLIDGAFAALLLSLNIKRTTTTVNNDVETQSVKTDTLQTQTMDRANIKTDSVSITQEKPVQGE